VPGDPVQQEFDSRLVSAACGATLASLNLAGEQPLALVAAGPT
jgi:hypothetical protein